MWSYLLREFIWFQGHEEQMRGRINEVNNRMNEVESSLRAHKLENERVLKAEINERENQDKVIYTI